MEWNAGNTLLNILAVKYWRNVKIFVNVCMHDCEMGARASEGSLIFSFIFASSSKKESCHESGYFDQQNFIDSAPLAIFHAVAIIQIQLRLAEQPPWR
jgi:hypothetical protein